MASQEKLIKEIKSLSDSIRRKNRALRMGISERDRFLETTFKPVVDPLKEVSKKLDNITEGDIILPFYTSDVKNEQPQKITEEEEEQQHTEEPSEEEQEHGQDTEEEEDEGEEEELYDSTTPSDISKLSSDIRNKGELGRKYLLKMLHSTIPNRKVHVYGARLEGDGLKIGNSKIDVDEQDNIVVNGKKYKGSKGLFELIFKPKPLHYNMRDLESFKNICMITNAHKKGYISTSPIHRNRTLKYKMVISKLFPTKLELSKQRFATSEDIDDPMAVAKRRRVHTASSSGSGLLKNTYSTNIIYYNNVNKLVNRMRLIHEAIEAGHTGLQNEWVALVDELLKRGVITK